MLQTQVDFYYLTSEFKIHATPSDSEMCESSTSLHLYCLVSIYLFYLVKVSYSVNGWSYLLAHQLMMDMNAFVTLS